MKRLGMLFIASLIVNISCKMKYNYPKFDYNHSSTPCFNAFKDRVFFAILRESYKGTAAFEEISKRDFFNPYDGLPFDSQGKIDSIALAFVKKMPKPAFCDECTKEQNYFMAQALHYYKSNDLDSIVKVTFKNFDPDSPCGSNQGKAIK
jgi:hypothetical protein